MGIINGGNKGFLIIVENEFCRIVSHQSSAFNGSDPFFLEYKNL